MVHADTNPRFHALIERFKSKTGCPVLVNTSFNVRGEPIVCTPEDAFRCFMGNEVELLVLGNCMLRKSKQNIKMSSSWIELPSFADRVDFKTAIPVDPKRGRGRIDGRWSHTGLDQMRLKGAQVFRGRVVGRPAVPLGRSVCPCRTAMPRSSRKARI
jgi:hypothetical protein